MSPAHSLIDRLIWATRGRSWGFRFLLDAGLADPLGVLERALSSFGDESTAWQRAEGQGVLRIPDPLGRRDSAGRVIPHEFVVFGEEVETINSVEEAVEAVWPLVAPAYARVWDSDSPPSRADLHLTADR